MPQPPNSAISNAATFFRAIFADPATSFDVVNALVLTRAEENEWRDFKEASWYDAPLPSVNSAEEKKRREASLKEIWSQNLSAFGNTGDGLLIWGIRAPKKVAEKLSLAMDAQWLANRLIQLLIEAIEPPIAGVEVKAVLKPGSAEGFVVCYIPLSSFSPHGAKWATGGYYQRAQDNNVIMRTEILRRMFYPHVGPRLIPVVRLAVDFAADHRFHVQLTVKLRNDGSGSAKETFVHFAVTGDRVFKPYLNSRLWVGRYEPADLGYECISTIHPKEIVVFMNNVAPASGYDSLHDLVFPIECSFLIFADNAEATSAKVTFDPMEIQTAGRSNTPVEKAGRIVPYMP